MALAASATAGAPRALTAPPLTASRSAPLPQRESLLPQEFEGLSKEQAELLALATYLQSEREGRPSSQMESFQMTNSALLGFENVPAYPVHFEEAAQFADLVREGTPKDIYDFRQSKNKKQFALYYAGLPAKDKATYWNKYSDYEAELLTKKEYIKGDVTPRALEKYMNWLTNDEFRRLMENTQRLPNNVILAKGNAISRTRMSRKNRANRFKQKHQGLIVKSARTRRAAGEVPPPYVPPSPRRLGVPEPAALPPINNIVRGYSNEEKANFKRHVTENNSDALAAYLEKYPRHTLVGLYGTLNNASKKVYHDKRAAAAAPSPPPVAGPNRENVIGTHNNMTIEYINSLNDTSYEAFTGRLLENAVTKENALAKGKALAHLQSILPKMQRKDRRINLTNKIRKNAFLEQRKVIDMQKTVTDEKADAEEQLEVARVEEEAAIAREAEARAELARLEALPEKNESTIERIQRLQQTVQRTGANIRAIAQRIAFLTTLVSLGSALWAAGAAYLQGGILGGAAGAYYTAAAAYRAHRASQQYSGMGNFQETPVTDSRSAISKLEESMKTRKRVMTLNNISKRKIYVDVSLDLSEALGTYGNVKVHGDLLPKSTTSKQATASFGRHEVKIENGKLFVYINESPEQTIKREIPIPSRMADITAPIKKVRDMKPTISHNISLSSGSGSERSRAAAAAASAAASAAGLGGAGAPAPAPTPWLTISYTADVYVDNAGKYFFYFLDQPAMEIPLILLDKTWK